MRIDLYLVKIKEFKSREKAQEAIKNGQVFINNKICTKVATQIDERDKLEIKKDKNYVSRGAKKLLKAKETFKIDFSNKIILDIGASTGGFTQVALESGAKKIYALDVGKGELDESLVNNNKVINLEGVDFRQVEKSNIEDAEIIVGDISFISLKHIFPKIKEIFGNECAIYMLFKPQFECGKEIAKKCKGVIKDIKLHISLLKNFINYLKILGYEVCDMTYSPIKGKSGNIEYLFAINDIKQDFIIDEIVKEAFVNLKNNY